MSASVDFEQVRVGDRLRRSAIGSTFIGLFQGDFSGWLDDMVEEVVDQAALYGIELVEVSRAIEPIGSNENRATAILEVLSVDQDVAEQQAFLFGWVVVLVAATFAFVTTNIGGVRDDVLEVASRFAEAGPSIARSAAVVAIFFFLTAVVFRFKGRPK